jgi:two-component system response regulator LytT
MPLTALIVDDERLAREELKFLLNSTPGVEIVAEGSNGIEAVELIAEHQPDVVFLDVQMPGLDGFAVLKHLIEHQGVERLPQVVFATAYDQYAVRAFDVNAVDYVLKPFDRNRIVQALDRTRTRLSEGGQEGNGSATPRNPSDQPGINTLLDMLNRQQTSPVAASSSRFPSKLIVQVQSRLLLEVVPWFKSSYQLRMDDRKQTEIPVSRAQTRRLRELFNL